MQGVRHRVRVALRAPAVGAAVLLVATACATSPGPGPSAATGPASSTPAPSSPAAGAPAPSTPAAGAPVVRVYDPFGADGTPAVAVSSRAQGSCWTSSIAAPSARTWRCLAGNEILDPCFADPADPAHAVCVADPWSPGRLLTLTKPLPRPAPLTIVRPWALELANGARCVAVTGTVPAVDGVNLDYSCGAATAAGSGGASAGAPTTVAYGPRTGPLTRVGVTTVWRA